jgi:hypothetical protein
MKCSKTTETVHHYLLMCKGYDAPRRRMKGQLKRDTKSIRALLTNLLGMPMLFQYISKTERFKEARRDPEFYGGRGEEVESGWSREEEKKEGEKIERHIQPPPHRHTPLWTWANAETEKEQGEENTRKAMYIKCLS